MPVCLQPARSALALPTWPCSMRITCLLSDNAAVSIGAATAMIRAAATAGLRTIAATRVGQGGSGPTAETSDH